MGSCRSRYSGKGGRDVKEERAFLDRKTEKNQREKKNAVAARGGGWDGGVGVGGGGGMGSISSANRCEVGVAAPWEAGARKY